MISRIFFCAGFADFSSTMALALHRFSGSCVELGHSQSDREFGGEQGHRGFLLAMEIAQALDGFGVIRGASPESTIT